MGPQRTMSRNPLRKPQRMMSRNPLRKPQRTMSRNPLRKPQGTMGRNPLRKPQRTMRRNPLRMKTRTNSGYEENGSAYHRRWSLRTMSQYFIYLFPRSLRQTVVHATIRSREAEEAFTLLFYTQYNSCYSGTMMTKTDYERR